MAFQARPTFQQIQSLNYASDYLIEKKRRLLRIDSRRIIKNYDNYLLNKEFRNKFNRSNLLYNLYSNENLSYVTTLSSTTVNSTLKPFYQYYTIDPKGELFGNSQCGELNFTKYMEPEIYNIENLNH
jgi:hypothetical protein